MTALGDPFGRWLEQVWEAGPGSRPSGARWLAVPEAVYRLALALASARSRPAPLPIVSVGSLWVGGAGKTPLAGELAAIASEDGLQPALLLRGYGGSHRSGVLRVPDEADDPGQVGDEACLHALRGAGRVYVARRRLQAAFRAAREGCDLGILDDGMQHRRLERQLEVVTLRGSQPLANGRVLPAGPLREPPGALQRARVVILAHTGPGGPSSGAREAVLALAPGRPVFSWQGRLELRPWTSGPGPASPAPPRRVAACAGIGWPAAFQRSLEAAGCQIVWFKRFPDHHRYAPGEIEKLLVRARQEGLDGLVTTEKDAVRLRRPPEDPHLQGLWIARLTLGWNEPEARETLRSLLRAARADWSRGQPEPAAG